MRLCHSASQQQFFGVFDKSLDCYEELHSLTPIDNAMIIRKCHIHHRANHDFIVDHNRTLLDFVHPQNANLGWVENGSA